MTFRQYSAVMAALLAALAATLIARHYTTLSYYSSRFAGGGKAFVGAKCFDLPENWLSLEPRTGESVGVWRPMPETNPSFTATLTLMAPSVWENLRAQADQGQAVADGVMRYRFRDEFAIPEMNEIVFDSRMQIYVQGAGTAVVLEFLRGISKCK